MKHLLLLLLLLAPACGRLGFDPLTEPAQSGTRLKIVWNETADGSRLVAGIYDSLRDERCDVQTLEDGRTYCVPSDRSTAEFGDATCSTLVGLTSTCTQSRYYVQRDRCSSRITRIVTAGAPYTNTEYWQRDVENNCVPQTLMRPAVQAGVELIPSTDLVELVLDPPIDGARPFRSADGFMLTTRLHDPALGTDCTPRPFDDGYACVPTDVNELVYGLDDQCTSIVSVTPLGCPAIPYVTYRDPSCTSRLVESTSTLGGIGGFSLPLCRNSENGPLANYYLAGADVSATPLEQTLGPGLRLRPVVVGGVAIGQAFDTALGVLCAPAIAGDGVTRCLPVGNATIADPIFIDPSCTSTGAVALASPLLGCHVEPNGYIETSRVIDACTRGRDIHSLGSATAAYYINFPLGGCTLFPDGYTVGTMVDPTTFAELTTVTDP